LPGLYTESNAQAGWRLAPSLTLSETYNSNVNSTPAEVEDYITKVGANLAAIYDSSNASIQASYLIELLSFAKNPELNIVTQNGSLDIDLNRWFRKFFKEVDITVTEDFTFTPDLMDYYFDKKREQVGSLSSYGIKTSRAESYRNAFSIGMKLPLSQRQNITTKYTSLLTEYSDPAFVDNIAHSVSIGASYRFIRDEIYGDIGINNVRADSVDSNIYSVNTGIKHSFSARSLLNINVGIDRLDSDRQSSLSTKMKGGLSFTRRSRFFTYNAGYQNGFNTASGISRIPTLSQIFYMNITGIQYRNLVSDLGADYAVNKSIKGEDVDTQSYNLSAGLSYLIRPWLQSTLSASHFNQSSKTLSVSDITRNLITLQISALWDY
jgi:hypothetical protein